MFLKGSDPRLSQNFLDIPKFRANHHTLILLSRISLNAVAALLSKKQNRITPGTSISIPHLAAVLVPPALQRLEELLRTLEDAQAWEVRCVAHYAY
tara:strand:- start:234 stop:521 length:288 start_codon:yes stop_codon:yes gene_type:complete